jgi:Na+-translocating ferredoxin:NAD+ oxidoreductase RnfC subunit
MKSRPIIVRVEATYHLTVQEGDSVRQGQRLCEAPEAETEGICPVSGVVRRIQFDPEHHEFMISISKE